MGPRQDAGEDLNALKQALVVEMVLQWGPGRMPGKTSCLD